MHCLTRARRAACWPAGCCACSQHWAAAAVGAEAGADVWLTAATACAPSLQVHQVDKSFSYRKSKLTMLLKTQVMGGRGRTALSSRFCRHCCRLCLRCCRSTSSHSPCRKYTLRSNPMALITSAPAAGRPDGQGRGDRDGLAVEQGYRALAQHAAARLRDGRPAGAHKWP